MDTPSFSSAPEVRSRPLRPYGPPRRRSLTRSFFGWLSGLIRFFLATVLFFALMTWAVYSLVSHMIVKDTIKTPNLMGKPISEAIKWLGSDKELRKYNLSIKWEREQASETVEKDNIISQNPAPGEPSKMGRAIGVVVSGGIALVTVPDLRKVPQNRAGTQLRKAGLVVGSRTMLPSTTDPMGTVLESDPPAGTGVPQGSRVNLLVATGQTQVNRAMPNLVGMKLDQARDVLTQAGLFATEVQVTSPGAPADQVVGQSPAAGDSVSDSTHIQIKYTPPRVEAGAEDAAPATDNGLTTSAFTEVKPGDLSEVPAVALPSANPVTPAGEGAGAPPPVPTPGTQPF